MIRERGAALPVELRRNVRCPVSRCTGALIIRILDRCGAISISISMDEDGGNATPNIGVMTKSLVDGIDVIREGVHPRFLEVS
jgi:hypothetical protein